MSDGWYPDADDYYVSDPDPALFPVRQGDLMQPPDDAVDSKGRPWVACQVIHPSCEIVAKAEPPDLQVIRVLLLSSVKGKFHEAILRGLNFVDGSPRVAWANTFFLPPAAGAQEPMFADFRQPRRVPRAQLDVSRRVAALTHDTRVYFIRRKLYWEQRWLMDPRDLFGLEASRIRGDPKFLGEKPEWAVT